MRYSEIQLRCSWCLSRVRQRLGTPVLVVLINCALRNIRRVRLFGLPWKPFTWWGTSLGFRNTSNCFSHHVHVIACKFCCEFTLTNVWVICTMLMIFHHHLVEGNEDALYNRPALVQFHLCRGLFCTCSGVPGCSLSCADVLSWQVVRNVSTMSLKQEN